MRSPFDAVVKRKSFDWGKTNKYGDDVANDDEPEDFCQSAACIAHCQVLVLVGNAQKRATSDSG